MPELIIKLGDTVVQRYSIEKDVVSIGRAKDNDIVVENLSVSRNHARIRLENGRYSLVDLNSANGSFINGTKITQAELSNDDIISIGKHKLHFVLAAHEGGAAAPTAADMGQPVPAAFPPAQVPAAIPAADAGPLHGFLLVTRGKQQNVLFQIVGSTVSIGRASDNDIRLHDWFVSKKHATIAREGDAYILRDLGSWRGLTVNAVPTKEATLKPNDEIIFGTTMVKFLLGPENLSVPGAVRSTDLLSDVPLPDMPEGRGPNEEESLDPFSTQELARRLTAADLDEPPPGKTPAIASLPAEPTPPPRTAEEDEFEPLSQEELEELERETDEALDAMSHEERREAEAAEWEQVESDRLLAEGAGWERKPGAMLPPPEAEQAEADVTHEPPDSHALVMDKSLRGGKGISEEEREEEDALFKGPVADPDTIPMVAPSHPSSTSLPIFKAVESPAPAAAGALEPPPGVDANEFRKWARGLKNKSKIVRREAARKLKELTGNDYDWESEPR